MSGRGNTEQSEEKLVKKCPLCGKRYPATAKRCPLKHCPNCGSTKLIEMSEPPLRYYLEILGFLIAPFTIGIVIGAVVRSIDAVVGCIGGCIITVLFGMTIVLDRAQEGHSGYYECCECGATFWFFFIKRNIPLEWVNKVCPACGAITPLHAKFCGKCGHPLPEHGGGKAYGSKRS